MSGYAWSSNIGWIKFGGLSGFPGLGSDANVNTATGAVTGWARACAGTVNGDCSSMTSRADGWDGWIELSDNGSPTPRHASPNINGTGGVTYRSSDGAFIGFAWGGPVVGWVQFNGIGGGVNGGSPSGPGDSGCPSCGSGGVPVITGTCSADKATITQGDTVTFTAHHTSGTAPYSYSWSGAASTTATDPIICNSSSCVPSLAIGDTESPTNGYSGPIGCPAVTVLAPLGPANMHISKGTVPSGTFNNLAVTQGIATPFNIAWNINLTSAFTCRASIGNDPGLPNWNSNWTSNTTGVVLNSGNATHNLDGTYTWNGDTGGNLTTPASGLNVGSYVFTLTCTDGNSADTQTTSATLRVTTSSVNEI